MVTLDAIAPLVATGVVTFLVGIGAGYFGFKLRVRRKDAREARDKVMGPLLGEITDTYTACRTPGHCTSFPIG